MVEKCLPSVENEIKRLISIIRSQSVPMNEHRYQISINRVTNSYVTVDLYPNSPYFWFGYNDLRMFSAMNDISRWMVVVMTRNDALYARFYQRSIY